MREPRAKHEQFHNLDTQHFGESFQPGYRWRVHTTFNKTDELHRAIDRFRKLHLCQLPFPAQVGDARAEFLLKHCIEIPNTETAGNGA